MRKRISTKEEELRQKDEELERLKEEIEGLEENKRTLAVNSSKCLNDMREYLLIYQNAVFNSNSH